MTTTTTTTPPAQAAQEIIRRLLEQITLHPDELRVDHSQLGRLHTIKIQVHRGDMSRVIGAGGEHARSIDALVGLIGRREGVTIKTRLIEPEVGQKDRHGRFEPREVWDSENALRLVEDITEAIFEHPVKSEVFDGEDYVSVIEVTVSERENKELVEMVSRCMAPLFNALGKKQGRQLTVNVAPGDIF